jgi:hypothetical protein
MNEPGFYQLGEKAYEQRDYLATLGHFLSLLGRQGIDSVKSWNTSAGIKKLALYDADRDTVRDIAALSNDGRFYIFLRSFQESSFQLEETRCHSFCFLEPDRGGEIQIALSRGTNRGDLLTVYGIVRVGNKYALQTRQDIAAIDEGSVLDMVLKQRKLYVSTTNKKIYQYNGINFQLEQVYETRQAIRRLITNDIQAGANSDATLYQHLLGISRDKGLVLYNIESGRVKESNTSGDSTEFTGARIADTDNDGTDDIVACSRNGKVYVFSSETLRIKYEYSFADELYDLYCDDIDHDGKTEILVGAKSSRIHVLKINANRELEIKQSLSTEHRVWTLWVGDVDNKGEDKRLVAGLANGELQVFKVYPSQQVNRRIHESFRGFMDTKKDWSQRLLHARQPEIVRFGLDQVARDMDCPDIITFLGEERDYESNMAILPKLKVFLGKYPDDPQMKEHIGDFLERLFAQHSDLPTCEQICTSLEEIALDPTCSSEQILELLNRFRKELYLRKPSKVQLIGAGKIPQAQEELKARSVLGIDLLKSYGTRESIRHIHYSSKDDRIIFTTNAGSLGIIDADWESHTFPLHLGESELYYFPVSKPPYSHILFYGTTPKLYDEKFGSQRTWTYGATIRCAQVIDQRKAPCWVVGLDDGSIILDGPNVTKIEHKLPAPPLKIVQKRRRNIVDVYIITLDGSIFALLDLLGLADDTTHRTWEACLRNPVFKLDRSINVLDFLLIDDQRNEAQFLILGPEDLYRIRNINEKTPLETTRVGKPLTCVALCDQGDDDLPALVVGTQNRSLVFVGAKGTVQRETYLSDIPTALLPIKGEKGSLDLLVGFAQGDLDHYRYLGKREIERLQKQCDRADEFSNAWNKCRLGEKLALIAIAKESQASLEGMRNHLDPKIRLLVPGEALVDGVKSLHERGSIQDRVEGPDVYYFSTDDEFREWVGSQKNQFEAVRIHRNEIIDALKPADVPHIDKTLREMNAITWLFDFLLIDSQRWSKVICLSEMLQAMRISADKETITQRRALLEFICSHVQAVVGKAIPVQSESYSMFEMQIPQIKFKGFDRILAIVSNGKESIDLRADLNQIAQSINARIVLGLIQEEGPFLRDALRGGSFHPAVLTGNDLKHVLLSDSPREEFLDRLISQIDIAALSPFQIAGPVKTMFYGRENEKHLIMNSFLRPGPKGYAVIGPRRIGKTSLLIRMQEEIKNEKGYQAVFIDAMPYMSDIKQLYNSILHRLDIKTPCQDVSQFVSIIDDFCHARRCKLVILIDEVDDLVKADEANDLVFLKTLRALINEIGVKMLIAGYSTLYFQMRDAQSPLFNMLERIELSALERPHAFALIEESFRNLYSIDNQDIDYILDKTACYPNFIQFCCQELVNRASKQKMRRITREDIKKVVSSQKLYDYMVRVYLDNLDDQTQEMLLLLMAQYDPHQGKFITNREGHERGSKSRYQGEERKYEIDRTFTPYELHHTFELNGIRLDHKQLMGLMGKLVLASVLRHEEEGKQYSFTLPDLPEILRKHIEIEEGAAHYLERQEGRFPDGKKD